MTYRIQLRENPRMEFTNLVALINAALARQNLSARAASLLVGHSDVIRNIRRGSEPAPSTLVALSRVLDMELEDLTDALMQDTGRQIRGNRGKLAQNKTVANGPDDTRTIDDIRQKEPKDLPIMGGVSVSLSGYITLTRDPIYFVEHPAILRGVAGAHAVFMQGSTMAPRFESGDILYINPARPITPGCYVLVRIDAPDGRDLGIVGRFVEHTEQYLTLALLNPPGQVSIRHELVTAVNRIVQSGEHP